MIVQALETLWWLLRNPHVILYGWMGMWVALLYGSASSLGAMNAVQFAITGMLNSTSILGLVPPLAAFVLMNLKNLQRWILRAIIGVFRAVQRQILSGAKDAAKGLAKAKGALAKIAKGAKGRQGSSAYGPYRDNGHLGESPEHQELGEALDELANALDMYQGIDFFN